MTGNVLDPPPVCWFVRLQGVRRPPLLPAVYTSCIVMVYGSLMPLTAADVRTFREQLAPTQAVFADLVGVTANTVARWEQNAVRVPEPAARLIRLLAFLDEEERPSSASDPTRDLERAVVAASVLSPLSEYAAGRGTKDAARAALRRLRKRGRRGHV